MAMDEVEKSLEGAASEVEGRVPKVEEVAEDGRQVGLPCVLDGRPVRRALAIIYPRSGAIQWQSRQKHILQGSIEMGAHITQLLFLFFLSTSKTTKIHLFFFSPQLRQ